MTELEVGFSPEMVAATLAPAWGPGPIPKTQGRQPVEPQPTVHQTVEFIDLDNTLGVWDAWYEHNQAPTVPPHHRIACPFGRVGDILKVQGSELRLEVEAVRMERLQDAKLLDLAHEGWLTGERGHEQVSLAESGIGDDCIGDDVIEWFADVWDKRYAGDVWWCGWEANPRVWVVTFRRVLRP